MAIPLGLTKCHSYQAPISGQLLPDHIDQTRCHYVSISRQPAEDADTVQQPQQGDTDSTQR